MAFVVGNRWVLSVISLFAYVLTKIAVAIFAGGIVFSVLLPEMHLGPLDSFWIGSIMLMYIVQRALGAPGEQEARRGSIFAAGLKLLPVFIFIIPGIICFALAASGKVPAIQQVLFDANGELIRDQAQKAFPLLVATVLPAGVRGIVVAGLLAALMSSLAGVFNASATLFTMDFYSKLHPGVSQHRLVWIGRVATALVALVGGFLLGIFHLAVDTPVKLGLAGFEDGYTPGSFLWVINNMFFQYYSLMIFLVCVVAMVAVSYATRAPDYAAISGLTYGTITAKHRDESRASWDNRDVIASAAVLIAIVAAYVYFSG